MAHFLSRLFLLRVQAPIDENAWEHLTDENKYAVRAPLLVSSLPCPRLPPTCNPAHPLLRAPPTLTAAFWHRSPIPTASPSTPPSTRMSTSARSSASTKRSIVFRRQVLGSWVDVPIPCQKPRSIRTRAPTSPVLLGSGRCGVVKEGSRSGHV